MNTFVPNAVISSISVPNEGGNGNLQTAQQNVVILNSASLKSSIDKPKLIEINANLFLWEPYITNGFLSYSFREMLEYEFKNGRLDNISKKYKGFDILGFTDTEMYEFENNSILAYLPLSTGRTVFLSRFEISRPLIYVEQVTQASRFVDVFTYGFPKFSASIKAVVYGKISDKVRSFFNTVFKHISNGNRGSLYVYDSFQSELANTLELNYTINFKQTPLFRILPTNIAESRDSSDNRFINIEVSGIILEELK